MKKLMMAVAVAAFMVASIVQAQSWGLWEADRSWIGLGDGEATDWYSLWDNGVGTFNAADLGPFMEGGNYQIWNWDVKSWGDDAQGAALWVTIFETDNRPAETTFEEWWQTNDSSLGNGDRRWDGFIDGGDQGGTAFQMNILDGLAEGDYTLEVYIRAWGAGGTEVFDNNAGNNFAATFEVIPEPGTIALLGLGLLGVLGLRRRLG